MQLALHGFRVDFFDIYAAAGGFGFFVAVRTAGQQRPVVEAAAQLLQHGIGDVRPFLCGKRGELWPGEPKVEQALG